MHSAEGVGGVAFEHTCSISSHLLIELLLIHAKVSWPNGGDEMNSTHKRRVMIACLASREPASVAKGIQILCSTFIEKERVSEYDEQPSVNQEV